MLSLRQAVRLIPRLSSRISSPVARRTFTSIPKTTQLSRAWSTVPFHKAAYSTASPQAEQTGNIDHELSAKLESELQLEAEATAQEGSADELPPHLKTFLDHNPWNIEDASGTEEVILTRKFGKENIKVIFSIADINDFEHDPDAYSEDPALYDEDAASMQQGGAQSKDAVSQGHGKDGNIIASQDASAAAEGEEIDEDALTPASEGFPARLQVTITKDGTQGALHIESMVRDGEITTQNVHYFANADLAEAQTAEQDWSRRNLYTGPPFANLDEDLQALIDQYTAERGIDTALALWIPEYMDFKEQREYVAWLQATKNFVDA